MPRIVLRWIVLLATLFAIGPAVGSTVDRLRDVDGGGAVTLLVNGSLGGGLLAAVLTFAVAGALGYCATRFFSLSTGIMCAGSVLGWSAWGMGRIDEIVRRAESGRDFPLLAAEGLVVTLLSASIMAFMERAHDTHAKPDSQPARRELLSTLITGDDRAPKLPALGLAVVGGAIVGGAVVWLIAVTYDRGQTLAAALLGSLAAAGTAHIIAGMMRCTITALPPMLSMAILAAVGPLAAMQMHGDAMVDAMVADRLFALARPVSLDWAAGAMLGVPIGLSWVGSMLEKRTPETV
jgi:hypothetical protein